MGLTLVLSGSANSRRQAVAALKQVGFSVEDSEDSHGFAVDSEQSYITAHGPSVDMAVKAVAYLQWVIRSHWEGTGNWQKVGGVGKVNEPDPMAELEKLKSQLRAAGINLGN